jgi:hypothetical protein
MVSVYRDIDGQTHTLAAKALMKLVLRYALVAACFALASCASPKVGYRTTEPDPNDVPPSSRFLAILAALDKELAHYAPRKTFYLGVGGDALAALQEKLPHYDLHAASETYTISDSDWPVEFVRSWASDQEATRVHIQFERVTESAVEVTLFVATTYPAIQQARYTVRLSGGKWTVVDCDRPETPKI